MLCVRRYIRYFVCSFIKQSESIITLYLTVLYCSEIEKLLVPVYYMYPLEPTSSLTL